MRNLWTESDKAMITEDGNVRRYIGSDIIDVFEGGGRWQISPSQEDITKPTESMMYVRPLPLPQ